MKTIYDVNKYKYINKKMIRFLYCTMERIFVNIKQLKRANNIAHSQKNIKVVDMLLFFLYVLLFQILIKYSIFIYLIFIQIITV